MLSFMIHREALKERQSLPAEVGLIFAEVEEVIVFVDAHAAGLAHKRESGWGKRAMLVADARHMGVTYRMAWEAISRSNVFIWQYGPHEGFYKRLDRRANRR